MYQARTQEEGRVPATCTALANIGSTLLVDPGFKQNTRPRMGTDDHYAEQSADEIFSGPTHELVPSSYSSFHRHHWPHHEGDEHYNRDRRNSMWSSHSSRRGSEAGRFNMNEEEEEEELGSFHFFTRNEISHAEGASTVLGDDDSVHESFIESDAESLLLFDGNESSDGDTDHHEAHRPLLIGDSDSDSLADVDNSSLRGVGNQDQNYSQHRKHHEYRSKRLQQRYYIAEEDMRIVCAGYSIVRWRLILYYILCYATGGIVFLLVRWFPRHKLSLIASETPLGRCDLVVIENQWGELEQIEVGIERYNHPLSTIFNLANMEATESSHDTASQLRPTRSSGSSASSYVDSDPNVPYLRSITYRYIRFFYNPVKDMFFTNIDWVSTNWVTVANACEGLDGEVQERREKVFGRNCLEIAQPSIVKLLLDELLHPFYIFQVFSIILWSLDEYLYYASAIFVISVISVGQALSETKQSLKRIAEVAHANSDSEITVLRSGYWLTIPSNDLVPGDVYELSSPTLTMIPVDSVLLSGDCIVNESILTGESVPVSKNAANDDTMKALVEYGSNVPSISRNFLYSGTKIIRVRKPLAEGGDFHPSLAMAVRTGFITTKGALVRSMMFPKPNGFRFYRDSFRYIGVMAIVAMIGFSFSAVNFVLLGMDVSLIILRALDIITVVVPPALPATLTIGTNFSLQRLRDNKIFCITPSRVNVGGRVNIVAFDKTGTLTDEGLDVLGVHLVNESQGRKKFGSLLRSFETLSEGEDTSLLDTLITCHELKKIDSSVVGDPLDVKMFEFTGWEYDEDHNKFWHQKSNRELIVYKHFEFVSHLRRMSVIASSGAGASSKTRILAKGAPEVMLQICKPESLPLNFEEVLHQYTHRGFRVIACAWRDIVDIADYERKELESELTFAGLIIFENKLKPQSKPSIETLNNAGIRTLMCTGDNMLTAISVGRECAIVPPNKTIYAGHFDTDGNLRWESIDNPQMALDSHTLKPVSENTAEDYVLAITGDVFSHIVEQGSFDALDQMLIRGVVFARMSPDEKHELVAKLQQIDYTTCFCGDGANDCGALKEADVGISLSEAEASVAAPFTSHRFDISCVIDVIAEGRCALATSFGCFKYMSMYSAIQFVTVSMLYSYGSNIGDFQFLWIDLFLIVPIAAFMAWGGPAPKLTKKRPGAELVSRKVLVPLLSFMLIVCAFQVWSWKIGHVQGDYVPPMPGNSEDVKSTDNTVLFYMSSFQYIIAGWLFCDGPPFRVKVSENLPFILTIGATIIITLIFMNVDPSSSFGDLMDLVPISTLFKVQIVGLAIINLATMHLASQHAFSGICNYIKQTRRYMGWTKTRPRYKEIAEENSASSP